MKKLAIVLLAVLMFACGVALIACNDDAAVLDLYIFEKANTVVSGEFELPAKIGDLDAVWTSDSELIKITDRTAEGKNFLATPSRPGEQTEVKLTVKAGSASKTFSVFVAPVDVYDIAKAFKFAQEKQSVTKDFDLKTTAELEGKTATIKWSVEDEYKNYINVNAEGNKCLVTPSNLDPDVRIQATFTYNNESTTKNYRLVVSKDKNALELVDYWYNNTGVSVPIKGWVVEVATAYSASYNNINLYVLDENGNCGYYVYRVNLKNKDDGAKIKRGSYVEITGTTNTNYNGLIETNAGGQLVIDESKNLTAEQMNAKCYALDNDILGKVPEAIFHTSQYVSLEGWTVDSVSNPAATELDKDLFKVKKNGVTVTVRISKYMEGVYKKADEQAAKDILALQSSLKKGDVVNLKGILGNYKGYTLNVIDAKDVVKSESPALTNDQIKALPGVKAGTVIENIQKALSSKNLNLIVTKAMEAFTLPASTDDVTVKYEVIGAQASDEVTVTEAGVLTIAAPTKHDRVHVQATLTVGEGETKYETYYLFYVETWNKTDDEMIADEKLELYVDTSKGLMAPVTVALQNVGSIYGANVPITWALKEAKPYANIVTDSKGNISLVISETTLKDQTITLVATIKVKDSDATPATKEFTFKVTELVVEVKEPVADKAYQLVVLQKNTGKTLYAKATVDSNGYLGITEALDEAAPIYVETVKDGIKIYFKDGTKKLYVGAERAPGANDATKFFSYITVDEKKSDTVWVIDDLCIKTTVPKHKDETGKATYELYMGTYSSNNRIALSETSFISADNAGVSQFAAFFAEVSEISKITAQQTADIAVSMLKLSSTKADKDGWEVELPSNVAAYQDASVAWSIKETTTVAVIAGGKLTVAALPKDATSITVVATVTVGTGDKAVTAKKEISVAIDAAPKGLRVTSEGLGLTSSYKDSGEDGKIIDGVKFVFTKLGDWGSGIQFSKKSGGASVIWNSTAFATKITEVQISFTTSKNPGDKEGFLKIEFADNADFTNAQVVNLNTVGGQYDYDVAVPEGNFTFIRISNNLENAFYLDHIQIVTAD